MEIGFLNFYGGVLNAGQDRASLIANNIANADTPGYKATDIDFNAAIATLMANPDGTQGSQDSATAQVAAQYREGIVGLDGNDVSLDSERVEAASNAGTMGAASTFLHQSTSDLVTALRPNPAGN
jgi:flagellar basal-body rod protein FlgB